MLTDPLQWQSGGALSVLGVVKSGGAHIPCFQTDTCKNITFTQLLLRTVMK